jgi:hypothetical protein
MEGVFLNRMEVHVHPLMDIADATAFDLSALEPNRHIWLGFVVSHMIRYNLIS